MEEKPKFKVSHAQISIGIVCLVMAFAVTLQIKSVRHYRALDSVEGKRADELQAMVTKEKDKNTELLQQVIELKDTLVEYKQTAANSNDYSSILSKQLEKAELLAGLTAVEGPGITVTLRDNRKNKNTVIDPNIQVVHDGDLLSVINELCDSGAEALSLNGERLVATSEVRCAGATVSVNNTRYSEPFEIKAIGDANNMENALMMRGGVYDYLTSYGIEVTVKKSTKLTINSFKGTINYKYATPIKEAKQ